MNGTRVNARLIASTLGLLLGLAILVALELLDDSLKSPEDVTRHLALPTLGLIPTVPKKS